MSCKIQKLIDCLNEKRKATPNNRGYLSLQIESNIYNLMIADGPMVAHGGRATLKSTGTENDMIVFLKNKGGVE